MNEHQISPLGQIKRIDPRRSNNRIDVCRRYNPSKRSHFRVIEDEKGWTADLD